MSARRHRRAPEQEAASQAPELAPEVVPEVSPVQAGVTPSPVQLLSTQSSRGNAFAQQYAPDRASDAGDDPHAVGGYQRVDAGDPWQLEVVPGADGLPSLADAGGWWMADEEAPGSAGGSFEAATAGAGGEVPHRAEMESAFGQDFSGVSAHTGQAGPLSAIGANAAASGETVAFAQSSPSKQTVAHELTHVVQAREGRVPVGDGVLRQPALEAEARRAEAHTTGAAVASGGSADPAGGLSAGSSAVQLEEAPANAETAEEGEGESAVDPAAMAALIAQNAGPDEEAADAAAPPPEAPAPETADAPEAPAAPQGGGGGGAAGGDAGGMPGGAGESAETPALSLDGADAESVMSTFASAPPSSQASSWSELGGALDTAADGEVETLTAALPEYVAAMEGEEAADAETGVETPTSETALPTDDAAPAPEPEIEQPEVSVGVDQPAPGISMSSAEGSEEDNARAIGRALGSVSTGSGDVTSDPGPVPEIPLEGTSDPALVSSSFSQTNTDASAGRAEAEQMVLESPGSEQVQPLEMAEPFALDAPPLAEIEGGESVEGMETFAELALPGDVTASFDSLYAADLGAPLQEAESEMAAAADTRDAEQQALFEQATSDADTLTSQAQTDQEAVVSEQRQLIEDQRADTIAQQQTALDEMVAEADAEQAARSAEIDGQVTSERARLEQAYTDAQSDAQSEIDAGERDAAEEKRKAEADAEDRSWWEAAVDFVADCLSALTDAINAIFDAVRDAVSAILDAVVALAGEIIDAVCSFVCAIIEAYGELLKGLIQGLLGELFPELAEALCGFVDSAVTFAQEQVQALAETLKEGVASLAEWVESGINAVLDIYQGAINLAIGLAQAALTGDWDAVLMMALEAALQVCGIDPETFYSFVGRAEETIDIIVNDPGAFVGNCIDAVGQGFGQFSDNFLTHLQSGFIEWLTGAVGEAGITMPESFDLAGIFSIVAQVLGLTKENLKAKVEEHFGENAAAAFDFVWDSIAALIDGGWEGLWEHIQDSLSGLWDDVIGAIQDFLMEKIVVAAVTKIASMFSPVGAIVQAILTAWNLYTFLRDQIQRIWGVVTAVIDGIGDIARGSLGAAAGMVEDALASLVPVAIDLLASLLGIGGVTEKVKEVITAIQGKVSDALDAVIEKFKALFSGGGSEEEGEAEGADGEYDGEVGETVHFEADGESHRLWIEAAGTSAEVMVASTPMTVEDRIRDWRSRLEQEPSATDGEGGPSDVAAAQTHLSTAASQLGMVEQSAEDTLQAEPEEKDDRDEQTEVQQDALANALGQLFALFSDELPDGLTPEDIAQHEALAADAVSELKAAVDADDEYAEGREKFETRARVLETEIQPQLKEPIQVSIQTIGSEEEDAADGDLDFEILIAPNTTRKVDRIRIYAQDMNASWEEIYAELQSALDFNQSLRELAQLEHALRDQIEAQGSNMEIREPGNLAIANLGAVVEKEDKTWELLYGPFTVPTTEFFDADPELRMVFENVERTTDGDTQTIKVGDKEHKLKRFGFMDLFLPDDEADQITALNETIKELEEKLEYLQKAPAELIGEGVAGATLEIGELEAAEEELQTFYDRRQSMRDDLAAVVESCSSYNAQNNAHSEQAALYVLSKAPGALLSIFSGVASGATVHAAFIDLVSTNAVCQFCTQAIGTTLRAEDWGEDPIGQALLQANYKLAGGFKMHAKVLELSDYEGAHETDAAQNPNEHHDPEDVLTRQTLEQNNESTRGDEDPDEHDIEERERGSNVPEGKARRQSSSSGSSSQSAGPSYPTKEAMESALSDHDTRTGAMNALGLSPGTFYRALDHHGLR